MPVAWLKTNPEYSLVVWKSLEEIDELLQNAALNLIETMEWNSFKSESRKREWLTTRNALQILLPGANGSSIYYYKNGKPNLMDEGFISISHSHEHIALMKSNDPEIGIDIEIINERILKLSQKFLNEREKENVSSENQLEKLHAMWGAKEVLYKIHTIGDLDFKKDLFVHPFDYKSSGELFASILKKGFQKDFKIFYEKMDQYMLSWSHSKAI